MYVKYIPRRPRFKIPREFERPPDFSSVADSVLDTPKARWKYMQRMKAIFAGRPLTFVWKEDPEGVPPSTPDRVDLRVRHAKIKMAPKRKSPLASNTVENMGDDDEQPQSAQEERHFSDEEEEVKDPPEDPKEADLRAFGEQWVTFCKDDSVMLECERVSSVVISFVIRHMPRSLNDLIAFFLPRLLAQ